LSGATNFSYTLTNAQPTNAGAYTVVITNMFGSVTSMVASLTVTYYAPTVSLLAPASNSVFKADSASVAVTADARDADGSVTQVAFYSGSTNIVTLTSPYTNSLYTFTWSKVMPGTYTLTAVAHRQ